MSDALSIILKNIKFRTTAISFIALFFISCIPMYLFGKDYFGNDYYLMLFMALSFTFAWVSTGAYPFTLIMVANDSDVDDNSVTIYIYTFTTYSAFTILIGTWLQIEYDFDTMFIIRVICWYRIAYWVWAIAKFHLSTK